MDEVADLERAREYHRRQAWADACDAFRAIDQVAPLAAEDLGRLAESTHVLGRADEAVELLQRLYQLHVGAGATGPAVRVGFYLWHALIMKGDFAHAGGWIARARRLADSSADCPDVGFLLIPDAERQFSDGDFAGAFATAEQMAALAGRLPDRNLVAIAVHIQGRARIRQERVVEGLALLDEALVEVTAGATSPAITSWIYCSVIDACRELHELRRAREWTTALNAWCDARPQYTGVLSAVCRIHRAELLQLDGAWPDAVREAQLACERLGRGYGDAVAGRGVLPARRARTGCAGTPPRPRRRTARPAGTAASPSRVWRSCGWRRAGSTPPRPAIRRRWTRPTDRVARSRLLPAYVEIMLAAADVAAARAAADELAEIAERTTCAALHAARRTRAGRSCSPTAIPERRCRRCAGRGSVAGARRAVRGRAGAGAGRPGLPRPPRRGHGGDGARRGAPGLRPARRGPRPGPDRRAHRRAAGRRPAGLSPREVEVLRLVAAGKTNHAIAAELFLSERTVERHVSNILTKLGVGSRTAAAAYAFERGIR